MELALTLNAFVRIHLLVPIVLSKHAQMIVPDVENAMKVSANAPKGTVV